MISVKSSEEVPQKNKHRFSYDPSNSLPDMYPKSQKQEHILHPHVHSSIIHNQQKTEAASKHLLTGDWINRMWHI